MDRGGVEGGEGNRVGWMGEPGEGSCLVGEERGKNTTGLMGETGEGEACFVGEEVGDVASLAGEEEGAGLVGEEEVWDGLVGDDGEGQESGVEGVSTDKQGAADGDVGDVLISGGAGTGKEVMVGSVSAEGEGET